MALSPVTMCFMLETILNVQMFICAETFVLLVCSELWHKWIKAQERVWCLWPSEEGE